MRSLLWLRKTRLSSVIETLSSVERLKGREFAGNVMSNAEAVKEPLGDSETLKEDMSKTETVKDTDAMKTENKRTSQDENDNQHKKLKVDNNESTKIQTGVPWKKVILMISYSGKGYFGMQRNVGFNTIEEELLTALHASGCLTDEARTTPQLAHFQRAARTDKGVSAACQVVSIKMPVYPDVVERLNSHLPPEIRVMCIKRVTKKFNCKYKCDARTYTYTMPTFAFTPLEELTQESYRITPDVLEQVNNILKQFKGTHNFHNFTSRRKPDDPSCNRYMMQFECGKPVDREGLEFVTVKVKGQSFMLHQIRKMIGVTIAILRGMASIDILEKSWSSERVDIPIAPALGLLLEEIHYESYNRKFEGDGLHETLTWKPYAKEMAEFKEKFILPTIVQGEIQEKSMMTWLSTLPNHTFDFRDEDVPDDQSNVRTEIGKALVNVMMDTKAKEENISETNNTSTKL